MKRYFLHLSYVGTRYRGWQRQPEVASVQEVIEDALSKIFKEEITIYGCGRTDAGVHASQYFAQFQTEQTWNFDLLFRLNKVLPDDISIHDIIPVSMKKHARFLATERSYQYFIHTKKVAHLSTISTLYDQLPLDFNKMQAAANLIPSYTDFLAFCKTPDAHPSTLCEIKSVSFTKNKDATQFCFEITANRFLRGMIRNLMAKIISVGNGEISPADFEALLKNEAPEEQLPIAAAPQGLYLSRVVYGFLDVDPAFDRKVGF
jgi:tRNA pseudouridine38-40 synthase